MVVLSLFDGISCGKVALDRAGIRVDKYYASEIDRNAIEVSSCNHPNIEQLGNVQSVDQGCELLLAGSPCQGFSQAGRRKGLEDPRSKLFFEFLRLLDKYNPMYWLLENTKMAKKDQEIITSYLGTEPHRINSLMLSAQNRDRLYWTNIPLLPIDSLDIVIEDIALPLDSSPIQSKIDNGEVSFVPLDSHSSRVGLKCLGGLKKDGVKMWLEDGKILQRNFPQGNRVYCSSGKAPTLNANSGGLGGKTGLISHKGVIRKLQRVECERLQTLPDGYTKAVSSSTAISLLGNGWTVDVIAHIFKGMKV